MPSGVLGESIQPPEQRVIGIKETPLIEIILRRHPQETQVDRLKKEYIRTSHDVTVDGLKMFLGKKLSYSPYTDFQVCVDANVDCIYSSVYSLSTIS